MSNGQLLFSAIVHTLHADCYNHPGNSVYTSSPGTHAHGKRAGGSRSAYMDRYHAKVGLEKGSTAGTGLPAKEPEVRPLGRPEPAVPRARCVGVEPQVPLPNLVATIPSLRGVRPEACGVRRWVPLSEHGI